MPADGAAMSVGCRGTETPPNRPHVSSPIRIRVRHDCKGQGTMMEGDVLVSGGRGRGGVGGRPEALARGYQKWSWMAPIGHVPAGRGVEWVQIGTPGGVERSGWGAAGWRRGRSGRGGGGGFRAPNRGVHRR